MYAGEKEGNLTVKKKKGKKKKATKRGPRMRQDYEKQFSQEGEERNAGRGKEKSK